MAFVQKSHYPFASPRRQVAPFVSLILLLSPGSDPKKKFILAVLRRVRKKASKEASRKALRQASAAERTIIPAIPTVNMTTVRVGIARMII